jgi:hypothetical protein
LSLSGYGNSELSPGYNFAVPVPFSRQSIALFPMGWRKAAAVPYKQYCSVHYSPCSLRYSTVTVPYRYSTAWYCPCPSTEMSLFRKVQYCTIPVHKGTSTSTHLPRYVCSAAPLYVMQYYFCLFRYSAVRRQGEAPPGQLEPKIIDYQVQKSFRASCIIIKMTNSSYYLQMNKHVRICVYTASSLTLL